MGLFRREQRAIRRWYRKKRWWIVIVVLALGIYDRFVPNDAFLRDEIDRLIGIIPDSAG